MLLSRVERAYQLNIEINEKKKELDKLKAEIKAGGVGVVDGESCQAIVESRITSSINEPKALQKAKDMGAKWLIKEAIDLDALEDAIAAGEIDAKEFADCIIEKTTLAVKFKARK